MILKAFPLHVCVFLSVSLAGDVPPSSAHQERLPKQVWSTLKEARQAAVNMGRTLVLFAPEDGTRYEAALTFLKSLEGTKARLEAEVWLANPGDPEAAQLLDQLSLRSLPALVSLSLSGRQSLDACLGGDCIPFSLAFAKLLESKAVSIPLLREWIGQDQSVEPFLALAVDRKKDLGAAGKEPHRAWLIGLLGSKDKRMRDWAATRLVEANAVIQKEERHPFPIFLDLLQERFDQEVRQGNRRGLALAKAGTFGSNPNPPMADLGDAGQIGAKSPLWPAIRESFQNSPNMVFNLPLYYLMAPNLIPADRAWILRALVGEAKNNKHLRAQDSVIYWVATDWLLAFGKPADWATFGDSMVPMAWDSALAELIIKMKAIPGYWDSQPELQSMFCEGVSEEAFWEHPDVCLAGWGITREALVEFGIDKLKNKGVPIKPKFPAEAQLMGFTTTLRLRMLVGADGKTKWVRPEPGYALSFFAPTGISFAMRWKFEPARVGGVPRPSQFQLTLPFGMR